MGNEMDNLEQIEAERNDLTTKLGKIEERKSTVSRDVYEKVKKEYEHRLKLLDEKMASNTELIKAEITRMRQAGADYSGQEKDIRLMIEETELRYSIGEYNADEYNERSAELTAGLKKLEENLENIRLRVKKFEGYAGISEPAAPEPEPEPVVAPEPAAEAAEVQPPPEAEVIDVAELQETAEPAAAPAGGHDAGEEQATAPPVEDGGLKIDEHILATSIKEQVQQLDELLTEEEAVKADDAAPPAKETKGVTCPKCGHANKPDSWYCEKCGAEILETPSQ